MKLLGYDISISKATPEPLPQMPLSHDRGRWWWPFIQEPYTGAWQRNDPLTADSILSYFAVYACISLISQDVGKVDLKLMEKGANDLWRETESAAFSPLLRAPNHFQTPNQFIEQWIISKLIHGNTYALKERDQRGVVVRLYILDPSRTQVMVSPNGDIFYQLNADNLSGLELPVRVPASEIMHDVMSPLRGHPLCGMSPLLAAALPVSQGLSIQRSSSQFFASGSRPGGILTSPHVIDNTTAARLKDEWEQNFSGENAGKVAVLGDGLKFESMGIPAEEAQLIEQLKWTAENVCSVYHVPPYMIGVAAPPAITNNVEALQQVYYSQCLQALMKSIESLFNRGLRLNEPPILYRVEFELDDLLRMDTATLIEKTVEGVKGGILSPNEARRKFNLPPTRGGESPLIQMQDRALATVADEREAARLAAKQPQALLPPPTDDDDDDEPDEPLDVDRIYAIAKSLY